MLKKVAIFTLTTTFVLPLHAQPMQTTTGRKPDLPPAQAPQQEKLKLSATVKKAEQEIQTFADKRFSISETNDAAIMGLQEALSSEEYRPNDVGYTHGVTLQFESLGTDFLGMSGTLKITYVSDLISEFTQKGGNSIQSVDYDEYRVLALDIYKFGVSFDQHPTRTGLKLLLGAEFEYITDSPQMAGSLSFLSARHRQQVWHEMYQSEIYEYHEDGIERYSINSILGFGLERDFSPLKIEFKSGVLAKLSPSQQARDESKIFSDLRFSLNDPLKTQIYYRKKADHFVLFAGGRGEYGKGHRADLYAGIEQNLDFSGVGQFEISLSATLPVLYNFFDYRDFTEPRVYNAEQFWNGGILDSEPVYTFTLAWAW